MLPKNRPPTHFGLLLRDFLADAQEASSAFSKRAGLVPAKVNEWLAGNGVLAAGDAEKLATAFGTSTALWVNADELRQQWFKRQPAPGATR